MDAQPNNNERLITMKVTGHENEKTSDFITLNPGTYYISIEKYYHATIPYTLIVK